jgi:hypothetical protein
MRKAAEGIAISTANLRSTCASLRTAFGPARFDSIVSTFNPAQTRGLAAYQLERARAHPMAVEWHELMQAVTQSEDAGKLLLPERSFFLLDNLVRLNELLDLPNIERVLVQLEHDNDYYSTMFEIFVLSGYRQSGASIEIVPESRRPNERRPDFVVRTRNGDCYVECKSLEDLSRREDRLWEQIEGRVVKVLISQKRSWRVLIRARRPLSGRDIPELLALIKSHAMADDPEAVQNSDGQISIEFRRYTIFFDAWLPGGRDAVTSELPRVCFECETMADVAGSLFHKNLGIVEAEPYVRPDETQRILDDISDAHGQIPQGACGIVHVEIPFRKATRLLDTCDLAYQRAFGLLRRKTRLNAAVLSARSFRPNLNDGDSPFLDYHAVVPGPSPAFTLPKEMVILGSTVNNRTT